MWFIKYLVKNDKLDLIPSLEALDEEIIEEAMDFYEAEKISDLKNKIINEFKSCFEISSKDIFTQVYFQKLLDCENTQHMIFEQGDVESLWLFVYKNEVDNYYSYYIPKEIKDIIYEFLK
jgi:hypothetical protein